jgi:hypothetical protein
MAAGNGVGMRAPAPAALRAAVRRLPHAPDLFAAALHLALPADVAPEIAVRRTAEGLVYRGTVTRVGGDVFVTAATVAAAGHRPGDVYLDLNGPESGWLKPIRSGVRQVLFGTGTLFGSGPVSADPQIPACVAVAAAADLTAVAGPGPGPVVFGGTVPVLAERRGAGWHLCAAADREPRPVAVPADAAGAVGYLRRRLGSAAASVTAPVRDADGAVHLTCGFELPGGWSAVVPVRVDAGSETFGVGSADIAAARAGNLPPGWTWLGRRWFTGEPVAVHDRSGVVAEIHGAG